MPSGGPHPLLVGDLHLQVVTGLPSGRQQQVPQSCYYFDFPQCPSMTLLQDTVENQNGSWAHLPGGAKSMRPQGGIKEGPGTNVSSGSGQNVASCPRVLGDCDGPA